MEHKQAAVFGIYASVAQAARTVDVLVNDHFSNADISMLVGDPQARTTFQETQTRAQGSMTTGLAVMGTIRHTLGLIADTASLPRARPSVAAGPMTRTLTEVAMPAGGLAGAFVRIGVPDYEAKRYEDRIKNGGVVLSVDCQTAEEIAGASVLLTRTGAWDVSSTAGQRVRSDVTGR